MRIETDNEWYPLIDYYELTDDEKNEYDYLDEDSGEKFFRYKEWCYCLGDFFVEKDLPDCDGVHGETYFSGKLVKLSPDGESVKVGEYYSD